MKRVVVEELLPGMVLVKPVTNNAGLSVLAAGTLLDSTMIQRLGNLALTSVYVEGESDETAGKTLEELEADLSHRFRTVGHDPVQRLILQRLLAHLRATHSIDRREGPADV